MFPECVYQDTIDVIDGDAENHGNHILDYSYVQAVPIDNYCDIPVRIWKAHESTDRILETCLTRDSCFLSH